MKEVKNQNLWNFELGSQERMIVPVWIIIGLQRSAGILLPYDDDNYSQGYAQIKEAFRASTKEDIIQPYTTDDDFRSSDDGVVELGYNLCVFDERCQQNFSVCQPIKVESKIDPFLMMYMDLLQ